MIGVTGTIHMTVNCFCSPPKKLTADSEHQSARCEDCGAEILVGIPADGPRLRLVEPRSGVEEGDPRP